MTEADKEQAVGLIRGGIDVFVLETSQDMRNVKAAYTGIKGAEEQHGPELPLIISCFRY
ncbi:homocysteine S-methyltransferase family protein [Salibacterium sp. K-3]